MTVAEAALAPDVKEAANKVCARGCGHLQIYHVHTDKHNASNFIRIATDSLSNSERI